MPLTKYKLHKKSLQDSINFNLSSSISIEPPPPTISENNHKRQRVESIEQIIPLKSTITIIPPVGNIEEQPPKKKTKTKIIEDQVVIPPVIQSIPEPPITQILTESVIEKDSASEAPISLPSTNGRIKELKSKTPTWKSQPPPAQGNSKGNNIPSLSHLIINYYYYRQTTHSIRF
jgi:hypothetical protein